MLFLFLFNIKNSNKLNNNNCDYSKLTIIGSVFWLFGHFGFELKNIYFKSLHFNRSKLFEFQVNFK